MKIAVYSIAKNEEKFVARWAESAQEADGLFILDTGSTDSTVSLAENLGVSVKTWEFNNFRFDLARNLALDAIPSDFDVCVSLDLDEVLRPGWRSALEATTASRPRYHYAWSVDNDTPRVVFGGDKIHARHGYRWKHPVHEILVPSIEETQEWVDLHMWHLPDESKSRAQYLPLLQQAVAESPDDERSAHYLAREYFFHGRYEEAAEAFKHHVSVGRWMPEVAASFRYLAKIEPDQAGMWLQEALRVAPDRREVLVDVADEHARAGRWTAASQTAAKALALTQRPMDYISEPYAWGPGPYDVLARASHAMGNYGTALDLGRRALAKDPGDERLQRNLAFYAAAVSTDGPGHVLDHGTVEVPCEAGTY